MVPKVGTVAIGRNEGERLRECLQSALRGATPVVYVDSGSTDGSVPMARSLGADIVELDMKTPFTAARARNAGFERLMQLAPDISYVQFVDGDCAIFDGWIEQATTFLDAHPDVAVACGRRRERYPDRSIYNWLCDIEWNTAVGEAKACGGDALMRVAAFTKVGRYRPDVIAGEEPELCVRLRAGGWRIWRLGADMTLHDAALNRFGQWWRRALRGGYAYALGTYLHGAPPERHFVRESRRALAWGVYLPLALLLLGLVFSPWTWLGFLIYPLNIVRKTLALPGALPDRLKLAMFYVLAHFPEGLGQIKFMADRLLGRRAKLIEYK